MDYRSTLNLPDTKFKMKANLAQREPEFIKKWEKEDLYGKIQESTKGRPAYILLKELPFVFRLAFSFNGRALLHLSILF